MYFQGKMVHFFPQKLGAGKQNKFARTLMLLLSHVYYLHFYFLAPLLEKK